jgi:hypothetical protein
MLSPITDSNPALVKKRALIAMVVILSGFGGRSDAAVNRVDAVCWPVRYLAANATTGLEPGSRRV